MFVSISIFFFLLFCFFVAFSKSKGNKLMPLLNNSKTIKNAIKQQNCSTAELQTNENNDDKFALIYIRIISKQASECMSAVKWCFAGGFQAGWLANESNTVLKRQMKLIHVYVHNIKTHTSKLLLLRTH